jgi:hypothetical protein
LAPVRSLVALDISLIAGQNRRIYSDDTAGAIVSAQLLVDRFRKDHDAKIKGGCSGPHIIGCLLTLNMPVAVRLEGGYVPTSAVARWTAIHLSQSASDLNWLTDFAARCERALFGPRHPIPRADLCFGGGKCAAFDRLRRPQPRVIINFLRPIRAHSAGVEFAILRIKAPCVMDAETIEAK